jgi:hypothetical protein
VAVAGIFPIGDTGEQFVVAEWSPDPRVIEAELLKMAADTENWVEPLTAAKEAFIYDTELHFETESDPYGRQWTALDEAYLQHKLAGGHPADILKMTGDLHSAAVSQENWIITERDVLFDTSGLPFYGPYHQAGTASEEVSAVLHKLRTGQEISLSELGTATGGTGRGKNLPQRMFIGADEDTIAEVEVIFLEWLNRIIDDDWPAGRGAMITAIPAFGGGFSLRGRGGQFVGSIKP